MDINYKDNLRNLHRIQQIFMSRGYILKRFRNKRLNLQGRCSLVKRIPKMKIQPLAVRTADIVTFLL